MYPYHLSKLIHVQIGRRQGWYLVWGWNDYDGIKLTDDPMAGTLCRGLHLLSILLHTHTLKYCILVCFLSLYCFRWFHMYNEVNNGVVCKLT